MKLILVRIVLISLIPLGAIVLFKAIRLIKKSFSGKTLLEIPFKQKSSTFFISEQGVYSIWQKGDMFKKLPVDKFRPVVTNLTTGEIPGLSSSVFRPNSNDGRIFKMKLFSFRASPGTYKLEITEGSSITGIERIISTLFPFKEVNLDNYFIQIRESQPFYITATGILLIIFSGIMMIGGLVFAILAEQIFT